jgi:hypothetical protein
MTTKAGAVIEQPTLQAVPDTTSAMATAAQHAMSVIERMASDPNVDVDKFERFMQMRERELARSAQEQFNAAMAAAQAEMRAIAADAYNSQTKSKYASCAALDRVLRPIYVKHGFAMSFNTDDAPAADMLRVLCDVTHAGGHCKTYRIDMPADGKGAKGGDVMTKTHATGAASSYGQRYLLKMIWNVAVGDDDNDGNETKQRPDAPSGFANWLIDFEATADNGLSALEAAWKASKPEYRQYLNTYGADKKKAIQDKAKAVKA